MCGWREDDEQIGYFGEENIHVYQEMRENIYEKSQS